MPLFDADNELTDADIDALQRALATTDRGLNKQIQDLLKEYDRFGVAKIASHHKQVKHLRLQPGQLPPCTIGTGADVDPEIMKIGKRLLRLGLSLYEPNPFAALKKAMKHKRRGRPPR